MSEKGIRARALFESGYTCAQSMAGAFAEELGLSFPQALKLTSGLGGGIGRLREVCGAVSMTAMILGQLYGSDDPAKEEKKIALYAAIQALAGEFRQTHGSIRCGELLGELAGNSGIPEPRTPEYYAVRPCGNFIADAADRLQHYIETHPY